MQRDDLKHRELSARPFGIACALSSLFEYLCEKNAVTHINSLRQQLPPLQQCLQFIFFTVDFASRAYAETPQQG